MIECGGAFYVRASVAVDRRSVSISVTLRTILHIVELSNVSHQSQMWMIFLVSPSQKIFLVAALLALAGCSKESAAPATPLVEQAAVDPPAAQLEEFRGSLAPGGIAATYNATFSGNQIKAIAESRRPSETEPAQTGEYEFYGARLIKYQGAALHSAQNIELQFDVQGKLLVARAGEKTVSAEEISAIRDRAQSLRSHAVAQRAVRGHDKN